MMMMMIKGKAKNIPHSAAIICNLSQACAITVILLKVDVNQHS